MIRSQVDRYARSRIHSIQVRGLKQEGKQDVSSINVNWVAFVMLRDIRVRNATRGSTEYNPASLRICMARQQQMVCLR
jgi:hypothetical protein